MSPCNAEPGIDSSSRVPGCKVASGFSLLELVVVMAILAIVAVMAMPALSSVVNSNRLAAQSNDLVASLQLARSEAVRRNARVTLCPSADGLTCDVAAAPGVAWEGWITVVDSDSEVLRSSVVKAPVQVTAAVAAITFRWRIAGHHSHRLHPDARAARKSPRDKHRFRFAGLHRPLEWRRRLHGLIWNRGPMG